jgi:2-polyprenyl-6-methoxyphenol hydroxylase-like FAD-dependent oxidoreductase
MSDEPVRRILVVGGSIGGLCAGIALRGIGAEVDIIERHPGPMETRGAGIVVQPELVHLLTHHGAPPLPTTSCRVRRFLDWHGGEGRTQPMPQRFTSWEAIYRTLRAAFPDASYRMGSGLAEVKQTADRVTAAIERMGEVEADLLVCADGAQSPMRRRLLSEVQPRYAGYIAWRGTLDEAEAGDLVPFFDDSFTFSEARSGGHILAYLIPGEGADACPGRRRINWVWYVGADEADLEGLLTDRDGQRHHSSLAQGTVSEAAVVVVRRQMI